MGLILNWTKCQGDTWCDFKKLELTHQYFNSNPYGVYIIWSNKIPVKIDYGHIKDKIYADRSNLDINTYPDLKVVWAIVDSEDAPKVTEYLRSLFHPKVNNIKQSDNVISVNLPW